MAIRNVIGSIIRFFSASQMTTSPKKVFIVQPHRYGNGDRGRRLAEARLHENINLIETLNSANNQWSVCRTSIYRLKAAARNPGSFSKQTSLFGSGNIEAIRNDVPDDCTHIFLALPWLTNRQLRFLEDRWRRPVFDRTLIVMNIFRQHAKSKLAKLQVEIADHLYYMRQSQDPEASRMRLHALQKELDSERSAFLSGLHSDGIEKKLPVVCVVGYTNVGKTSLIRSLVRQQNPGDCLEVDDRLFVTLDLSVHPITTKRKRLPLLLMDTVGFVSELGDCNRLIEAFSATLADALSGCQLLVLMFDASHPENEYQKTYVNGTVDEILKGAQIPRIEVLNKTDKCCSNRSDISTLTDVFKISCKTGEGVSELIDAVEDRILHGVNSMMTDILLRIKPECLHLIYKHLMVSNTFFEQTNNENNDSMLVRVLLCGDEKSQFDQKRFIAKLVRNKFAEIV